MKKDLCSLTLEELTGWMQEEMGQPAYRAKQLFQWLHEKQAESFSQMTNLPEELRESLKGEILGSNTTEEAMEYLERAGIRRRTGDEAAARLQRQILAWTGGRLRMDVILFTVGMGIFGCTEEGEGLRAFRLSQRGERP